MGELDIQGFQIAFLATINHCLGASLTSGSTSSMERLLERRRSTEGPIT